MFALEAAAAQADARAASAADAARAAAQCAQVAAAEAAALPPSTLLSSDAPPTATASQPPPASSAPRLVVGQRLHDPLASNTFVDIVGLLGAGGFGEVAKVYFPVASSAGHVCAAKVARAAKHGRNEAQLREARILVGLARHINCVHYIYAFAEKQHGALVIVMELADYGSAREQSAGRCLGGAPPDAQWVLDVGIQLARGLAHAHHHGTVHQDVSPANTLLFAEKTPHCSHCWCSRGAGVEPGDEQLLAVYDKWLAGGEALGADDAIKYSGLAKLLPCSACDAAWFCSRACQQEHHCETLHRGRFHLAKLADFGLAGGSQGKGSATCGAPSGGAHCETRTHGGHPWYRSPEQAHRQVLTGAADVWSWGATLRHMLAGPTTTTPPWGLGERVTGATAGGTGLSPSLAQFLLLCCEPEPSKRPTAADCARRLEAIFESEFSRTYFRLPAPPTVDRVEAERLWRSAQLRKQEPGRRGEAKDLYRRALALDPKCIPALCNLATMLTFEQGGSGEATSLLRRAVAVDPRHTIALSNLGHMLKDGATTREEAKALYRQALAVEPDNVNTLFALGSLLDMEPATRCEAESSYRRALAKDPRHAMTLGGLAMMLAREPATLDGATELYARARDVDPGANAFLAAVGRSIDIKVQHSCSSSKS